MLHTVLRSSREARGGGGVRTGAVFFVGSFGLPSSWVVCVWLDDRPDGDLLAWVCECGWVWLCGMSGGWIGDFTDPPAHPQPLDDDVNSVCVSGAWCSRARHTHTHPSPPQERSGGPLPWVGIPHRQPQVFPGIKRDPCVIERASCKLTGDAQRHRVLQVDW
jgi:hypothetical protein